MTKKQEEIHQEELRQNQQISDNIQKFGNFVSARHLEIAQDRIDEESIEKAVLQFTKINSLKTPKGKINVVLNFCQVINQMLKETQKGSMADGADVVFPFVIFALLKLH